ncbi:MAG: peptide deformylase [Phycisphaerales bacterium]|jgi:peptide deformylase|nr:peptide deformylase [Phycisphaerales bacterium]
MEVSVYHAAVAIDPDQLDIVLHPAPVLRQKTARIGEITDEVRAVADRMLWLMHDAEGIGLAAPQVGIPWRLFVTRDPAVPDGDGGLVFINPEIETLDSELVEDTEGCLSLPGVEVTVRRPVGVRVRALTLEGLHMEEDRCDHFARVYQHELDHLDGVLIIDRMTTMDRLRNRKAIRDLERR